MLFSDRKIVECVESGFIGVEPWSPDLVQPASLDVRLGNEFVSFNHAGNPKRFVVEDWRELVLNPGDFMLGATLEKVSLPAGVAARFEGKSSLGRIGLLTHITAGFIDPGFSGNVTVELCNVSRHVIKLTPGMRIGQLCFAPLDQPCGVPYGSAGLGSHYQGQSGPTPSVL